MQFEEFDKKVKEAAENHHPAYDEQAWAKMNKLLDKHLPEKEDRRRRFAWLFFLLFLVGGAGVFYGVQSLVSPKSISQESSLPQNRSSEKATGTPDINSKVSETGKMHQSGNSTISTKEPVGSTVDPANIQTEKRNELTSVNENRMQDKRVNPLSTSTGTGNNSINRNSSNNTTNTPVTPGFQSGIAKKKKKVPAVSTSAVVKVSPDKTPASPQEPPISNPVTDKITAVPDPMAPTSSAVPTADTAVAINIVQQQNKDTAVVKEDLTITEVPVAVQKKQSAKKQSRFFLTLSAGPDASFTKNGKLGPVIPVTGAGVGYIYRERLSIRAGFYNAAKVYTASPEAYKAPANFYTYYPFLVKVDADCRVYEIPVSLGYHFGARKNHSWFVSGTLSSYLMKRETYNYSYKTSAWGTVQQREWTLNNRNQHLFSVLGLSGGYQRKITDRISFIAEPYLRLPFQGVGYGKVKLNSAGMLFSLAIQPAALIPHKQKK
jgi:hypothetical protein